MLITVNLLRVMFAIIVAQDVSSCNPPHIRRALAVRYLKTSGRARSCQTHHLVVQLRCVQQREASECHSASKKPKRHRVNVCLPAGV